MTDQPIEPGRCSSALAQIVHVVRGMREAMPRETIAFLARNPQGRKTLEAAVTEFRGALEVAVELQQELQAAIDRFTAPIEAMSPERLQ